MLANLDQSRAGRRRRMPIMEEEDEDEDDELTSLGIMI